MQYVIIEFLEKDGSARYIKSDGKAPHPTLGELGESVEKHTETPHIEEAKWFDRINASGWLEGLALKGVYVRFIPCEGRTPPKDHPY